MSMASIRNKVRYLIGDAAKDDGIDLFTYNASTIFNLSEDNINSIDTVYKNDVEQNDSGFYTYDSTNNKITIIGTITSGDSLQINYTYYPNYSNTEINNYIQSALVYLSINNFYDYNYDSIDDTIYPDMETREENLLSLITATIINPDNKTIRLPDVTISVPPDFPLGKKINMIISTFKKDSHGTFNIIGTGGY